MATYFVFGNAPTVDDLINFTGIDEITNEPIKINSSEDKSGHTILNINGHMVGAQISIINVITAIYPIHEDYMGLRLLTILIEEWSEEHSEEEKDIATAVVDDEMSIYLEYL
jgi:hypothetical protein